VRLQVSLTIQSLSVTADGDFFQITTIFTGCDGMTMTEKSAEPSTPVQDVVIWRVRRISCHGGQLGREWSSEFFLDECKASHRLMELVAESNKRNPRYPFKTDQEELDGVRGYCNWQFGIMLTMDAVEAR
jgi:hypothetical protein